MSGRGVVRGTDFSALVEKSAGSSGAPLQHDALTGLPGRLLFQSILAEAIASPHHGLALLRLSVDDVATLRADHGQAVADALLSAVAGRLRRSIRSGDVAARTRDFDFALLMAADDVAEAACAAQRVLDRLREPYEVSGKLVDVTVSIGIAYADEDKIPAHLLLERSDIALERARSTGRSEWKIFRSATGIDPDTQSAMIADLHAALDRNRMSIAYEPIADIGSLRLRGADAVLQWDHDKIGLIRSGDFLPVINDAEAARLLLDWTFAQACRDLARLRIELTVAVPFDRSVAPDRPFVRMALLAIAETGIDPRLLQLAIPHRSFQRLDAEALDAVHALREAGIRIALEDYADTGDAASLRGLPIDAIRTAPSVLEELSSDIDAFARVQAMTGLARSLGLPICAKGVENEEELELVRRFGFDFAHGPLLGGALAAPEMAAHVRADQPMSVRRLPRF